AVGYVYLLKHGTRREYKIGRTNNPLRREGELGIQLPEKCQPVHYIKTDDPEGVEAYWHRRFAGKRKEGEWFALSTQDVRAFKRLRRAIESRSHAERGDEEKVNPMGLTLELPPDLAEALADAAARLGLSLPDYAVRSRHRR